jgi:hypothetical protein
MATAAAAAAPGREARCGKAAAEPAPVLLQLAVVVCLVLLMALLTVLLMVLLMVLLTAAVVLLLAGRLTV